MRFSNWLSATLLLSALCSCHTSGGDGVGDGVKLKEDVDPPRPDPTPTPAPTPSCRASECDRPRDCPACPSPCDGCGGTVTASGHLTGSSPSPPVRIGWIWADPHVHTNGCGGQLQPADLVARLVARNIQVGSALVWGVPESWSTDRARFTGLDDPASVPRAILHYDLEISEFPAGLMGHLTLLGLNSVEFSSSPQTAPLSGVPIAQWAIAQGPRSVIGVSHSQKWPENHRFPVMGQDQLAPLEFPMLAALIPGTFMEFEGPDLGGGFDLWVALENTGFQVAVSGASDYPCALEVGDTRTRLFIDAPLTYSAYLDAYRAGRTIYVDGDSGTVEFVVNDQGLGGTVDLASAGSVTVQVDHNLTGGGNVTILVNGEAADTRLVDVGPGRFSTALNLTQSSWIAIHAPGILTSATYVTVGGQPIRASRNDACFLVRYADYMIDAVQNGTIYLENDTQAALAAYNAARALFYQRFMEAGGVTCP